MFLLYFYFILFQITKVPTQHGHLNLRKDGTACNEGGGFVFREKNRRTEASNCKKQTSIT